jgi:hypothetical protein
MSFAMLLVVAVPALRALDLTVIGVWILAGAIAGTHAIGAVPALANATPFALLVTASAWVVAHLEDPTQARAAVAAGLLLWVAEESRDLSLTLRRPGQMAGVLITTRLPRWLGVAAAALLADAALVAFLRQPPISGWIWRLVAAGAVVLLLVTARPKATTGS